MDERIFRFEVQVLGDMPSFETFPIFDDYGTLIGGFTRRQGDLVKGFIAGTGYPMALLVSTEQSFYFTPRVEGDGMIAYAIVSEQNVSEYSIKVQAAYEEVLDVTSKSE